MAEAYAGNRDLTDPHISPLFANFAGFPPTYIQVGSNEILLDDSTRLRDRMKADGVVVRLDVFEGMWHVFQMAPFRTAYAAMDKCVDFMISELMHY